MTRQNTVASHPLPPDAAEPTALSKSGCALGGGVAALLALMFGGGMLLGWWIGHQGVDTSPPTLEDIGALGLAGAIAATLIWAAVGLGGPRSAAARTAGLVGCGLTLAAGIWTALSPLAGSMAHVGGWGQPWMPEIAIGAVISGYAVWLARELLRLRRGPSVAPGGLEYPDGASDHAP